MLLTNLLTFIFLRQTNHKNCNLCSPPGGASWTGLYWIVRARWVLLFSYPDPSCSIPQIGNAWFKKVPSSIIYSTKFRQLKGGWGDEYRLWGTCGHYHSVWFWWMGHAGLTPMKISNNCFRNRWNCWYEPGERRFGVPPLSAHCWSHHGKIKAHKLLVKSETNYERRLQVSKLVLQGDMEVTFAGVVDMGSQYNHWHFWHIKRQCETLFSCDAGHSVPSVL